jgi:6-pyruvoyltetrahydropterin/6-carboxytetrahydropterin synthase
MQITRRLEFDAGHRIPNHASLCRHLHGHRYAIEVTVEGPLVADPASPEQGMVTDFSRVKSIAPRTGRRLGPRVPGVRRCGGCAPFSTAWPDDRTVVFEQPPTAEHLAEVAFGTLREAYAAEYGERLNLTRVRIYETPNCWADAGPWRQRTLGVHVIRHGGRGRTGRGLLRAGMAERRRGPGAWSTPSTRCCRRRSAARAT